ncbi:MAG: TlpA family protein disulfide reductase [Bacteroidales bacterium]|nr:TlpA family protein disulfide reductase [Bacteroidales bacterium]
MNLKKTIKNYFRKKSKFSIASDIVFIALVVALLFPSSRMFVVSNIQRITLFQPDVEEKTSAPKLSSAAYQWKFRNMEGEIIEFSRFDDEVVFLNFWGTWCPPCVAEMPTIQDLYDEYGDKIAFVLVSNEEIPVIRDFMEKKDYTFPVYKGIVQPPKALLSETLPTTFLIAKDGRIALEKEGSARWDGKKVKEKIDALIKE